jgi:polyisoprenoid-binding protein YceI
MMTTEFSTTGALPVVGTYDVDPMHSTVGFVARHLIGAKVRGRFKEFSGTITIADPPEQSTVEAEVVVASVQTDQDQRDEHLRSGDFFEVEKYPTLKLRTTGLSALGGGRYTLHSELTVRDVTRPIDWELTYLGSGPGMAPDSVVVAFEASADIDRRDFGVSFSRALDNGGLIVGNKVRIELDVEARCVSWASRPIGTSN